MLVLELIRIGSSGRGTFGSIRQGLVPFVLTLERPWADNQQDLSCIPAGRYRCQRVRSPKFGNTFEVTNVLNRTNVLFHSGNTIEDTHGCILVGEEFSGTYDRPMLVSSQRGFSEFMKYLQDVTQFDLIIYDAPPAVPQPPVQV